MYVQNDYLMRLIGELIRAAAKIAFGKTVQWNLYRGSGIRHSGGQMGAV